MNYRLQANHPARPYFSEVVSDLELGTIVSELVSLMYEISKVQPTSFGVTHSQNLTCSHEETKAVKKPCSCGLIGCSVVNWVQQCTGCEEYLEILGEDK